MLKFLKRHRKIIAVSLLLGLAFLLFYANRKSRSELRWYDRALLWTITPVQNLMTSTLEGVVSVWRHYVYLVGLVDENAMLKKQKTDLEFQYQGLIEAALENQRLRKILNFQERIADPHLVAEVVALDLSSQFQMLRVNRGEDDGVALGMPVVGDGGVVGQVFRITGSYSDILVETDRNSRIDALVERSRARGIIVGAGRKTLNMQFKYLSLAEDIRKGDLVVTSGLDGVFPEGLTMGYVASIDRPDVGIFQLAEIQPTVEFSKIKEVIIILRKNRPGLPGKQD